MKGFILLHKTSRNGVVYVPEVGFWFEALGGGKRGWLFVMPTTGRKFDFEKFELGEPYVEYMEKTYDTVREVDVPERMVQWARLEDEKRKIQSDRMGSLLEGLFEKIPPEKDLLDDFETMKQSVQQVSAIMDAPSLNDIDEREKYEMSRTIQLWIHESGGLA